MKTCRQTTWILMTAGETQFPTMKFRIMSENHFGDEHLPPCQKWNGSSANSTPCGRLFQRLRREVRRLRQNLSLHRKMISKLRRDNQNLEAELKKKNALLRNRQSAGSCPICFEEFEDTFCREAVMVPCGHTICLECEKQVKFCPTCRREHTSVNNNKLIKNDREADTSEFLQIAARAHGTNSEVENLALGVACLTEMLNKTLRRLKITESDDLRSNEPFVNPQCGWTSSNYKTDAKSLVRHIFTKVADKYPFFPAYSASSESNRGYTPLGNAFFEIVTRTLVICWDRTTGCSKLDDKCWAIKNRMGGFPIFLDEEEFAHFVLDDRRNFDAMFVKDKTGVEVRTIPEVPLWIQFTFGPVMALILCLWNWFPKERQIFKKGFAISDSTIFRSVLISWATHFPLSAVSNRILTNQSLGEVVLTNILTTGTTAYGSSIISSMLSDWNNNPLWKYFLIGTALGGTVFTVFAHVHGEYNSWMVTVLIIYTTFCNHPNDVVLAKHKYNIINHSLVVVAVLVPIFFNEFCFQLLPLIAGFMNLSTMLSMYLFQGVDDKTIRFTHNGQVFFGKVKCESVYGMFRMLNVRPQASDPENNMTMDGTEITSIEVYEENIIEPASA
ncbi:hypothetical protein L5515_004948 [Caenorhabditis briggsae]|uniref:RING-type domain-containing protein n=1 Tax=Caenorhabditis briggsae TaxID=6238 RepID=A0AAE9ELX3_CAEBR|nr:hypothetical protein L5515_004948 [Caenorhabditis briggsae]